MQKKKWIHHPQGMPYASLHYMYRPLMCPFAARKRNSSQGHRSSHNGLCIPSYAEDSKLQIEYSRKIPKDSLVSTPPPPQNQNKK
jgi:hypothetical protein